VTVGSDAEGRPAVLPDPKGVAPGRGAHLHPTSACYELAVRRKAFGRALRWTSQDQPRGAGGLSSAALAAYIAHEEETEDREEGWSSSS
jgi:uncharacterized protein